MRRGARLGGRDHGRLLHVAHLDADLRPAQRGDRAAAGRECERRDEDVALEPGRESRGRAGRGRAGLRPRPRGPGLAGEPS
ncbi:Hypothetical protein A7982_04535 [Minicystis rosea]|nr:Hypothetical protein A7982_04535 [Minicystis rosea]